MKIDWERLKDLVSLKLPIEFEMYKVMKYRANPNIFMARCEACGLAVQNGVLVKCRLVDTRYKDMSMIFFCKSCIAAKNTKGVQSTLDHIVKNEGVNQCPLKKE